MVAIEHIKKYRIIYYTVILVTLSFLGVASLTPSTYGAGASLYLSPSQGTFVEDSTFNVSILMNTGDQSVNAVDVKLSFPPELIQVVGPALGNSIIQLWVTPPSFSNTEGTVTLQGGIPSPGVNGNAVSIATITFRGKRSGVANIEVLPASSLYLNDGLATNALSSRSGAAISIIPKPPEGPAVSSVTHPDQNRWYSSRGVSVNWREPLPGSQHSWFFNEDPTGIPDNVSSEATNYSFDVSDDGIWFFHVKALSNDVWGGTTHWRLQIDNTPPAKFPAEVLPSEKTRSRDILINFFTTDNLSGVDHYELKVVNFTGPDGQTPFFIESSAPYQARDLMPGRYQVVVRAFDKAGNFTDSLQNFEILETKIIGVETDGVFIFDIMIPWWMLIFLLLIISGILGVFIYYHFRHSHGTHEELYNQVHQELQDLRKHKAQLESKVHQTSADHNLLKKEAEQIQQNQDNTSQNQNQNQNQNNQNQDYQSQNNQGQD